MDFSDDDFISVNKGRGYLPLEDGTVSIRRNSITLSGDVGRPFANPNDEDKALIEIAYSPGKGAVRITQGTNPRLHHLFARGVGASGYRYTTIPPALKAARVQPGVYKRSSASPNIYVFEAPHNDYKGRQQDDEVGVTPPEEKYRVEERDVRGGDIVSWLARCTRGYSGKFKIFTGVVEHIHENNFVSIRPVSQDYDKPNRGRLIRVSIDNLIIRERGNEYSAD